MKIKVKMNKWNLIKLKTFITAQETIKMKRQPSEWEKIIASEATDKRLISKIYKLLMQKNKQPKKEISRRPRNRHFSKEDIQMVNKQMNRCSTSLIIKEMQIKTTMRYHFTPLKMAIIKKSTTVNAGEGVGKREPCCTASQWLSET